MVVWDRLPAHRSKVIKDFLRQGGSPRSYLAQLPSHAPELNPDEGVWNYLRRVALSDLCCHNLPELRSELRKTVLRLCRKTTVIHRFISQVYPGVGVQISVHGSVRRNEMEEKKRKPYEKPAVIFEKNLQALAANCEPAGGQLYTGNVTDHCKAVGACSVLVS